MSTVPLRRRNRLLGASFLSGALLAVGVSVARRPVYRAQAQLVAALPDRKVQVVGTGAPGAGLAPEAPEDPATQIQILRSPSAAMEARRRTGLGEGQTIQVEGVPGTTVLRITVEAADPAEAASLANALVEGHVEQAAKRQRHAVENTLEFVSGEQREAAARLARIERDLTALLRSHPPALLSAEQQRRAEDCVQLQARVAETRVSLEPLWARAAELRGRLAREPRWRMVETKVPDARREALVERLRGFERWQAKLIREPAPDRKRLASVESQIGELRRRLGRMPREQTRRTALPNPARAALRRELDAAEREVRIAQPAYQAALAAHRAAERALADAGVRQLRHTQLSQAREEAFTTVRALTGRVRELKSAAGSSPPAVRVLEHAAIPAHPAWPDPLRLAPIILLSGLAASLLAFLVAPLCERASDRIRSPADIDRLLGLATLGIVPRIDGAGSESEEQLREAFRGLRAGLGFACAGAPARRLLVTSGSPGEGRTTVAAHLAAELGRGGGSVVLVDAHLRRPGVHRLLEIPGSPGFSEVLAGMASLEETVAEIRRHNLLVLPGGAVPPDPERLLALPATGEVLDALAGRCDTLVIDGPPAGEAELTWLLPHVDAAMLVIRADHPRPGACREAAAALGELRVLGAVLNGAAPVGTEGALWKRSGRGPKPAEAPARPGPTVPRLRGLPRIRP